MHATSTTTTHGTPLQLAFGLLNIPIRIHKITDGARTTPPRSMFTPDGHPIGQQLIDKTLLAEKGEIVPVDRAAVVKMTEVGGVWVPLTDEEIAAQCSLTKGFAEIVTFVPVAEAVENYRVEEEIEWRPDTVKVGKAKVVDPHAAKAMSLLSAAMVERGVAALVLVPTSSGARFVLLQAGGRGGWVSFAAGVRSIPAAPEVAVTDAELKLAGQLVDQIGVGCPVLVDETGVRLAEFLVAKAAGGAVSVPVAVLPVAPVVDIMAQLAASVEAAVKTKKAVKAGKKAA